MGCGLLTYDEAAAVVAEYAARVAVRDTLQDRGVERVALSSARGRVLAHPVCADRDQPPFDRSARDGFACRAIEACTHARLTIAGSTRAGEAPGGPLPTGAAWEIMTGAPVPMGADAVMMVEHVEVADGSVRLPAPRTVRRGENISPQGVEARAGAELLTPGMEIGPAQIALAASCGFATLEVFARPRVAILCTGDELVAVESTPGPGEIRNSSGPMLAAMVEASGGDAWVLPIGKDESAALDALLEEAVTADLLLLTGGVSVGKFDLVEPALARLGARFYFTGALIQPGKPVVFGEVQPGRNGSEPLPFFGLPGNPISTAVMFSLFAGPVLAALAGKRAIGPRFALARLGKHVKTKPGLTRFLPAWCNWSGSLPEVALVPWQGSGDLTALARSNCYLVIPEDSTEMEAGEMVRILLGEGMA